MMHTGQTIIALTQLVESHVCRVEESCSSMGKPCETCQVPACRLHSRKYNHQHLCHPCAMDQGREDEHISRYAEEL